MAEHGPDGSSLIGEADIQADDSAGKHGPQSKTAVHFPVGKKRGQAVGIGHPAAFDETDKLQPVALQKFKPRDIAERIPFQGVAVCAAIPWTGSTTAQ